MLRRAAKFAAIATGVLLVLICVAGVSWFAYEAHTWQRWVHKVTSVRVGDTKSEVVQRLGKPALEFPKNHIVSESKGFLSISNPATTVMVHTAVSSQSATGVEPPVTYVDPSEAWIYPKSPIVQYPNFSRWFGFVARRFHSLDKYRDADVIFKFDDDGKVTDVQTVHLTPD